MEAESRVGYVPVPFDRVDLLSRGPRESRTEGVRGSPVGAIRSKGARYLFAVTYFPFVRSDQRKRVLPPGTFLKSPVGSKNWRVGSVDPVIPAPSSYASSPASTDSKTPTVPAVEKSPPVDSTVPPAPAVQESPLITLILLFFLFLRAWPRYCRLEEPADSCHETRSRSSPIDSAKEPINRPSCVPCHAAEKIRPALRWGRRLFTAAALLIPCTEPRKPPPPPGLRMKDLRGHLYVYKVTVLRGRVFEKRLQEYFF
ncbi:hypothetical protein ACRALDRAFT_2022235 [Sodiomyces alcalophilus JCM 7366]|uniref:uncharacterized protein n=1 Tax=Sodiomyces alcalophilus JCM 7366 TaxID=591952 RepID=UPI0039B62722